MKPADNINNLFKNAKITVGSDVDKKILNKAMNALPHQAAQPDRNIWSTIMHSKITKPLAAAIIIVAVLTGIYRLTGSIDGASVAFAQVQETVKTAHWMHVSYIWSPPAGSEYADYDNTHTKREFWYSYNLQVAMAKFGDGLTAFADYNEGTLQVYNPVTNRIIISELSDNSFPSGKTSPWDWIENYVLNRPHGTPITKRDDEHNGKQVAIYEMVEGNGAIRTQVIVDKQSQLPITEQMAQFEADGQAGFVQNGTFEYPQSGPEDIYALGVPEETEIVNTLSPQKINVLHQIVVDDIQSNISTLTSAVLELKWENRFYGAWRKRPGEKGMQKLWWNGGREFAAFNIHEYTVPNQYEEFSTNIDKKIIAWDGTVFRIIEFTDNGPGKVEMVRMRQPRLSGNDNFLRDIGWQGNVQISAMLSETLHTEPGIYYLSEEEGENGSKLIKFEFVNLRLGQIGIRYYDRGKGCGLVRDENYFSPTRLQSRMTIQYEQVSGGTWFPVVVDQESFNIQNGEVIQHRNTTIDLDKSVFNSPSAIPDGIFELKTNLDDLELPPS